MHFILADSGHWSPASDHSTLPALHALSRTFAANESQPIDITIPFPRSRDHQQPQSQTRPIDSRLRLRLVPSFAFSFAGRPAYSPTQSSDLVHSNLHLPLPTTRGLLESEFARTKSASVPSSGVTAAVTSSRSYTFLHSRINTLFCGREEVERRFVEWMCSIPGAEMIGLLNYGRAHVARPGSELGVAREASTRVSELKVGGRATRKAVKRGQRLRLSELESGPSETGAVRFEMKLNRVTAGCNSSGKHLVSKVRRRLRKVKTGGWRIQR